MTQNYVQWNQHVSQEIRKEMKIIERIITSYQGKTEYPFMKSVLTKQFDLLSNELNLLANSAPIHRIISKLYLSIQFEGQNTSLPVDMVVQDIRTGEFYLLNFRYQQQFYNKAVIDKAKVDYQGGQYSLGHRRTFDGWINIGVDKIMINHVGTAQQDLDKHYPCIKVYPEDLQKWKQYVETTARRFGKTVVNL